MAPSRTSNASLRSEYSQGYVVGAGEINDDFGDEGPLSRTANNHSNVVGMWQGILWADGHLANSGRDCWFGPTTEAATKAWQKDHGLDDDGIVGPLTFGKADYYLYWEGSEIRYDGSVRNLTGMLRDSQGRYYQQNSDGTRTYGSYTSADALICS
ncbi:peptidoglycan-binding domain-containing protein [Streptomyces sp. DSM 40750]|uniref:peptidoglycan-binding domain-containing protein n=1 Tax=Streptomyces sp. DSM 40750 TaxID=2801030 RepID=UPI00214BFEBB|nr:peptidoglycan-binding domain-containing protein [Streptomyces sp. DSM 40750]UUU19431.1 peptidoglycan-binding protein [Streptomyces sp. DSM 40750]UUU27225.1 peptidoglycan-binding protein [Streptomyces sp. DSM 40750]